MLNVVWSRRQEYGVAQVDVYSGKAFFWAVAVCCLLSRLKKPYVLTLHGGALPVFARRWPKRVRLLLNSAAAVTTPSRYLLEEMRGYRSDLRLYPNALDLSSYRFRVRSAPRPRLVWLRAFHSVYNPSLVAPVMALLISDFPNAHLTMIGPDKDRSLLATQSLASELGVINHITFPGRVASETVPSWLDQGDIFLNTTNVDNAPVSVLQAMAVGLCVVSTNVAGIPYILENERDGLLVPPNDAPAMARAVARILTDNDLAARLSSNAHKRVEHFDWSNVLPKWTHLLLGTAQRGNADRAEMLREPRSRAEC
jgi:glycosyltransferase involved in cell wall biosynthesis